MQVVGEFLRDAIMTDAGERLVGRDLKAGVRLDKLYGA